MTVKAITERVERLERLLSVDDAPKVPPFDYDLLTPTERDLTGNIHLWHDVAVRLGYGTLEACRYRFKPGCDPFLNPEIAEECFRNMTEEELKRLEVEHEIYEKCTRLTEVLTEEEKAVIKRYNEIASFFHPFSTIIRRIEPNRYTKEDLHEARLLYGQIMAKYGEKNYDVEDH